MALRKVIRAGAGTGGGSGPVYVGRDLTAQIDGIKVEFTTPEPYRPGTLETYVNGQHQGVPPMHFTETGPTTFRFNPAESVLVPREELVVTYALL